ncbi:MAG: hypothetical protein JXB49_16745 [Bacteroidales bacterium]|nr:hypothetical protein [Bacteroidales bacterium]
MDKIYHTKLNEHTGILAKVKTQSMLLGWSRLGVFVGGIFISIWLFKVDMYLFSCVLLFFIAAFAWLLKLHTRKAMEIKIQEQYILLNKNELQAIKGDYTNFGKGDEYIDREHPYSFDLDIFGEGSLYNAINRTTTINGRKELAGNLASSISSVSTILETQEAVDELKEKLDWRQKFQAYGNLYNEDEEDIKNVIGWLNEPIVFLKMKGYRIIANISAALTIVCILLVILKITIFSVALYAVLIEISILLIPLMKVNATHRKVSRVISILKNYKDLLSIIEEEKFNAVLLREHAEKLKGGNETAAQSINHLTKIIDAFDNRMNAIAGIFLNLFLLWDLKHTIMLERWRISHKDQILGWFDVLGKIDALSSFACFAFNHPDFVMPIPVNEGELLHTIQLGHPLIPGKERVDNDFSISRNGEFVIITGPNMAGKSTFLRTVGVNLVLAMAGAPVCADEFKFRMIDLFSSMRTSDSLQKGESYFYAELKRLQTIVQELKKNRNLFLILDEILKGTNSKDKEAGSKAFLKQMIELGGTGIIATHDLTLCEIERDFPDNIYNQSFEVDIEGKAIHFDYLLRTGITTKMNATFLMEQMGIINN